MSTSKTPVNSREGIVPQSPRPLPQPRNFGGDSSPADITSGQRPSEPKRTVGSVDEPRR